MAPGIDINPIGWILGLDRSLAIAFNNLASGDNAFGRLMSSIVELDLVKGIPFAAILIWFWFSASSEPRVRTAILEGAVGSSIAILIGRILQFALPFRARPLHDGYLHLHLPPGYPIHSLSGWSSFPSDNANLFFALCIAIWLINRRLGILCFVYTLLVVMLPRLVLGLHYFTDVLASLVITALVMVILHFTRTGQAMDLVVRRVSENHPALFQAALFLFLSQMATNYEEIRQVAWTMYRLIARVSQLGI